MGVFIGGDDLWCCKLLWVLVGNFIFCVICLGCGGLWLFRVRERGLWLSRVLGVWGRVGWGGMFLLLYGLWKYLFSKVEFYVFILGIDKVGKMMLLEKLKMFYFDVEGFLLDWIVFMVGLNIGWVEVYKLKFIFWDLGG